MAGSILAPKESYDINKDTLRDIIAIDHFSNMAPCSLVDLWLTALNPEGKTALPPGMKGFYNGDLRASIPIELAHDSYKYAIHETDKLKVEKYANRMLISLSLLDLEQLGGKDATLTALALWHTALAQARLQGNADGLMETLVSYEAVRPMSKLSDSKLPMTARLKERLLVAAEVLSLDETAARLRQWMPST